MLVGAIGTHVSLVRGDSLGKFGRTKSAPCDDSTDCLDGRKKLQDFFGIGVRANRRRVPIVVDEGSNCVGGRIRNYGLFGNRPRAAVLSLKLRLWSSADST